MACPVVVATATYGDAAGMSADGTLLYTTYTSGIEVRNFPSLSFNADVDLNPAMDALGAGGGGNIRNGTVDGSGHLFTIGYVNTGISLQVMRVDLDGTSPTLITTLSDSAGLSPLISWHPADPAYVYVLYETDIGWSRFSQIHIATGAETILNSFAEAGFEQDSIQQYGDGFVFFVGASGFPNLGEIWVYDIAANSFDSVNADGFFGMGTQPDGTTIWEEDTGGPQVTHTFTIGAGPTITTVTNPCGASPFSGSAPFYWFATPDRSRVYVGDGFYVWSFGSVGRRARYHVGRVVQTGGNPA